MTTSQVVSAAAESERAGTPAPAVPRPEPYRPPKRLTARRTGPRRLSTGAATAVVLLGVLCALAMTGAVAVHHDIGRLRTAVAERAAVAAQLRLALADLDAQRANTLVPGRSIVDPKNDIGNELNALITAHQRRARISDLVRRLGADTTQAAAVSGLLDSLGRYDDLSGRSTYAREKEPGREVGDPPSAAVSMNVQAGEIMRNNLLPAAEALFTTYQRQADDRAGRTHDTAVRWALTVGLLGAAALGFLLWWQRELARDYRRVVNLPLAVATAAVLAVTAAGTTAFADSAGAVTAAERDGLRPWGRLAEAGATAARAAATESRWFVHQSAFGARDTADFADLTRQVDNLLAPDGYASAAERPAYDDVRTRYGHFRADDRRLRTLKDAGRIEPAAEVLTDIGRDNVAFDFWDFSTTLDRLAEHQMTDFTDRAADARDSLGGWPAIPAGALGAAGALILLGLRPRYAEYR
jgi:hypothetical protein